MSNPPTAEVSPRIPPDQLTHLIMASKSIVAAAELLPFPYLNVALRPIIPILEAVQKMAQNREDFTELCASIVEIITLLQEEISRYGADAVSRLTRFCEQLRLLLQEIEQTIGNFQNPKRKGFRSRFKELGQSTNIGDALNKYKSRVHQLQQNFITSSVAQLNIHARGSAGQPPPLRSTTVCPLPSRIFHGRRDILDKMYQYFAQDIGNRHACLLYGLGGAGKTQIALKFLHEIPSNRFTEVLFLDASTTETIQAGLKNIALTQSIGSDHEDALLWLASCSTEWLLVFDNADDPKLNLFNFIPQSTCGNILITSRNPQLRVHAPGAHHRVSDLEQEAAVQLLLVSAAEPATSENEMLATEIVKVLHNFPLAVVQAGAYISKMGSLRRYLVLYEQNHARILGEVPGQSHDKYAWSVYTTWDISFKCLSKPAARFLQLCSFLHHEGISETIFSNAARYVPYPLGPTEDQAKKPQEVLHHFLTPTGLWDTISFADMGAEIQNYSLINQDHNTGLFSIHPLVHDWSRNTVLDMDATRECTATLLAMSVAFEDELFTMSLHPHVSAILQRDSQPATEFLYPYQQVYYDSRNFQKAQELCEDLLEKVKATLGEEHPTTLSVMARLATAYWSLGRLSDAEELKVLVLEKRRQTLGPEHPDTLTAMGNLANAYWDQGRLTDAEELDVAVLEKRKQTLGPEHPYTLISMQNLAHTYRNLGKLIDAEELDVVVLEKWRQTSGPEHRGTLRAMANLAHTYRYSGKLTDAEELELVILEKRRQTLGPEHLDTLVAMANLAGTYRNLGKLTEAEELEVVVLEKRKEILGPQHLDTLRAMTNLACTYRDLGKLTDAEELEVVVLGKGRQTLGLEHPDTLLAMANLACTYRDLGKLTKAEELDVVVLQKRKQTLGPEHLDTLLAMANLARTYRDLGRLTEAEELEVVVLEKRRQVLGPEHLETLHAMANLARTYRILGKLTEVEELEVVLLDKRRQILGPEHPDTLLSMASLACTYGDLGRWTEAEELEVVVLEKRRQTLGPEHVDTLLAMENLAYTYGDLGKLTDAEELQVVVVEKRTKILGPEHPYTLTSMQNLAYTYGDLGKSTDAEELEVLVLDKTKKTFGPEHPDTLVSMGNLAHTYHNLGKLTDAEELGVVVLEKRKQTLGPEHLDTLHAMANLARTYKALRTLTDAEELEVVVVEKRMKTLGAEHPDTLKAMGNLATTYQDLGKFTEAKQLFMAIAEVWTHSGTDVQKTNNCKRGQNVVSGSDGIGM
ncbi:putative kinesin [Mycena rebaudengoi]|nr:putative kinesin [Mycena rebaudengoi]